MPRIYLYGIQCITFLKNVFVLHGAGVGGGSLVYANTLMVPPDEAFEDHNWPGTGWEKKLSRLTVMFFRQMVAHELQP